MKLNKVRVLHNRCVGPSYYKIGLETGYGMDEVQPGQFVMIQIPGLADALLRRPFSIYRTFGGPSKPQAIEVLYRVVGKGTDRLSYIKEGELLSILGPLGKGFSVAPDSGLVYVIAGGIGMAPLNFLILRLLDKGFDTNKIRLFFGGRSISDAVLMEDLKPVLPNVRVATEDGTLGQKALVTDLAETEIRQTPPDMICACGPMAMLKKIGEMALQYKIPCQVSLEAIMACGLGACLGCAMQNTLAENQYVHVCKDGPVFNLKDFRF
ncbi:MAG: dihydroorotate dehydrogenase electron transfer subunit [Proteobacteria bacterium]|nr:dihydroorotate dehydrogenase electron transfer subunit [Pseudomonadota bacterium]